MTAIVVDVECFNNDIIKEMGVYKDGVVTGYSFLPPANVDHQNKSQDDWLTKNLHFINWDSGTYSYEILEDIVQEFVLLENVEIFAKGLEKCEFLSKIFNKQFTNLENFGCPKVIDLSFVDEKRVL